MDILKSEHNFLGITQKELYAYDSSKCVIQQLPYEHTLPLFPPTTRDLKLFQMTP